MKKIITIAREFGAGGRSVGKEVAKQLDIPFYDRDLILKTVEESNLITADEVRVWDEKVPKDAGVAQSLFNFYSRPLSDKIWEAQVEAIRHLADKESCVLVGRNAEYILREFDHVLRVFIYAGKEWRVTHMSDRFPEMTRSELEAKTTAVDKARKTYCEKYTGQKYGNVSNFDLAINTEKLGFDKAVELVLSAADKL